MHHLKTLSLLLVTVVILSVPMSDAFSLGTPDPRDITTGSIIPSENYSDQPFCIITDVQSWLCTLTTGTGSEGGSTQHIISTISTDNGLTWSTPVDIEPSGPPEASWAMPLKVPSGRIYVFYDYNADGVAPRADMFAPFMFKYSDDNGLSWSAQRYEVPIRTTSIDLNNTYGGVHKMGWSVGKPTIIGTSVYVPFSKIGTYLISNTEGWFLRSDNLLTESDPLNASWVTLPDGDTGLKSPGPGVIAEEHKIISLDSGSLFTVYRTVEGYIAQAYSYDGGHTWSAPEPVRYRPTGRIIKNPRANVGIKKFSNGKYVLWFHNNGKFAFTDRNPGWLAGGQEINGHIEWSEPEILLYDLTTTSRISYPDFIEQNGQYWITETQKAIARVHSIETSLLEGLWNQRANTTVASTNIVLSRNATELQSQQSVPMPALPILGARGSFTIDFWIHFSSLAAGQVILDSRTSAGKGIVLQTVANNSLQLTLNDGAVTDVWNTDPGVLTTDTHHHVVAIVDGSAKVVSFVVDGVLLDGGSSRQFGWHFLPQTLNNVNGSGVLKLGPSLNGGLTNLRIYDRYLRTSEAVGNYQSQVVPLVALTSPANDATVSGIVTMNATAWDKSRVSAVEFYVDGVLKGTDITKPYSYAWNTDGLLNNSTHALIAKAYDDAGTVGTSTTITVNVVDVTAPVTAITAPINNATVSGVVSLSATASDNVGVTKVEFWIDGVLRTTDTANPYVASWNTEFVVHNTVHTLISKAYDAAGNTTLSTPITVTVSDIKAPTVSMTSPANNATVQRNSTVTIQASASDISGISKVEFSVAGVLKCTDLVAPFSCAWVVPPQKKSYGLTAKAYDTANNAATSAVVTVTAK